MKLKRDIGLVALALYGIGDILGAGIYGLIGKAAGQMGNAVWLAFATSMVVAMLSGLSYAAVGSRFPKAAGAAFVTHKAFGKTWLTYVVGLCALASGLTSMAAASRVFSGYMQAYVPNMATELLIVLFALVLGLIVLKGIKESIWANSICTIIEVSGLLIIIILGITSIGKVDYLDATSAVNVSGELAPSLILSGAVLTFYSFIGFEDILNVSEEVKDPKVTVPRGLIIAIIASSTIYIIISLIAVAVVPSAELSKSGQPLVDVVKVLAPNFPFQIFSMISIFAVSNTALLNFIMGSRLIYGLSKQGLLPSYMSKINERTATPHVAIGFIFLVLLALALSGDISSLAKATSILLLLCFVMVNLSLLVIKKIEGKKEEGVFDVPNFVPVLGIITSISMLFFAKAPELKTAVVILAIILVIYFVQRPKASEVERMDQE